MKLWRQLLPLVLALAAALVAAQTAQAQEIEWIRQFGSPADDFANGVSADASGVYVAGWTWGALPGQTSAGQNDAFVRKYDHNGNEVWTRQFGSQYSFDYARGVSVHDTGVYVVGGTLGALPGQTNAGSLDAFVRKYDLDGNEVWTRQFGGGLSLGIPFDEATGISVHDSGVYVAGWTSGALPGQTDVPGDSGFVRKYDHNGNEVWTRQFGPPTIVDPFVMSTPVAISADGSGVYVATSVWSDPDWLSNGFVRKYDHDGSEVWTDRFAISGWDRADGISVDVSGVYVAGLSGGAFVRKYDASGNEVWTRQFGGWARAISVGSSGVYVVSSTGDAFVRKYDHDGNEVWTQQFGTPELDEGTAISVTASGACVAGLTRGALPGQSSAGGYDAFVAKLTENRPPVAAAGPDRTVIVAETVVFDGTGSSDPDGTIVSYEWDFGDGGSAIGSIVSNIYVIAGTYEVVLTITDDGGLTASDTAAIIVITPAQAIQQLSGMVTSFNFQQGISNSLGAKLQNAYAALEAANASRRQDARNKLQAFINTVEAQRGKGITSEQAGQFIALAMRILAVL